jgi:hypothetical protein
MRFYWKFASFISGFHNPKTFEVMVDNIQNDRFGDNDY